MGKSLLAATTVTGVVATAVPTTFFSSSNGSSNKFKVPTWTTNLIPKLSLANGIKGSYESVKCLKEYYSTITWNDTSDSTTSFNNINNFSNDSNSKSCLIVEYYKQEYTNDKWWGEFRLIWSLKDEQNKQGLIAVVNAKTDNQKLSGSTAAYYMKKGEGNESSWNVSYSKENNQITVTNSSDSNLIPSKGTAITDFKNNWDFVSDLQKICGTSDCLTPKNTYTTKSISWEFTVGQSSTGVDYWNSTPVTWLKNIFGSDDLSSKVSNVKGTWTKKSDSP